MHTILKVNKREKKSYKMYLRATDGFFLTCRIFRRNIRPSFSIKMRVRNTLQNEVESKSVETEV